MTVLSHLKAVSSDAVLNEKEKKSISTSIQTLEQRLDRHFGKDVLERFKFGSSTRGTILPRKMDDNSDIDYMVVFSNKDFVPATYLNRLKKFVERNYSTSEVYQSSPTIVLSLNHIKFEIAPAITGFWGGYKIPAPSTDYKDWLSTDPNDFNQSLVKANTKNKSLIKPLIRLIKYWNAQNGYVFDSFLLEKEIVGMSFGNCSDLKDYFYEAIDCLSLGTWDAQWKKDKLSKAKSTIHKAQKYENDSLIYSAEKEIEKLIPSI